MDKQQQQEEPEARQPWKLDGCYEPYRKLLGIAKDGDWIIAPDQIEAVMNANYDCPGPFDPGHAIFIRGKLELIQLLQASGALMPGKITSGPVLANVLMRTYEATMEAAEAGNDDVLGATFDLLGLIVASMLTKKLFEIHEQLAPLSRELSAYLEAEKNTL